MKAAAGTQARRSETLSGKKRERERAMKQRLTDDLGSAAVLALFFAQMNLLGFHLGQTLSFPLLLLPFFQLSRCPW